MSKLRTIAIVDDDELFAFLTTKAIESTNLVDRITTYGNGLDALDFLKENKGTAANLPDIIMLDLSMPIMDGWQFLNEYVNLYPELSKKIALYICSSSISPDDIQRAKTFKEVRDYKIKPITKDQLTVIIKKELG